jgi:hypothetical protein
MQLLGSYIVYNYLTSLLSILVFLLQFVDIRYYAIYAEKDKFREITKRLEKDTYFSAMKYNNGRISPASYFIGWSCIGYLDTLEKYEDGDNIRILTTVAYYKELTLEKDVENAFEFSSKDDESDLATLQTKVRIFHRYGTYKQFYYSHVNLNLGSISPLGQQGEIIDSISTLYDKKKRTTVFIYGVSYAGKSSIGYLLAKKYRGRFCHSFNPIDPGDQFSYLFNAMNSDKESDDIPTIVVLEEVDSIIQALHENRVVLNREVPTSVYNKTTWSTFLDDMIFYNNLILILTSNKSKDEIDKMDPAYLRKGRIDASYSMNQSLPLNDSS